MKSRRLRVEPAEAILLRLALVGSPGRALVPLRPAAVLLLSLAGTVSALAEGLEELQAPRAEVHGPTETATVSDGDLTAVLKGAPSAPGAEEDPVAMAEASERGRPVAVLRAAEGGTVAQWARATIAELDPTNGTREVVLEAYTGGAHCCVEVVIAAKSGDRWSVQPGGLYDGASSKLTDLDKDGVAEIASPDEDFQYAFGCYACSAAPLKVRTFTDGGLVDASQEPRFQAAHRAYLASLESTKPEGPADNGWLAGWVAEKALLGEGAEAWAEMLVAYDRASTWGLESCRDPNLPIEECPEGQQDVRSFPDALKQFLDERGYRF